MLLTSLLSRAPGAGTPLRDGFLPPSASLCLPPTIPEAERPALFIPLSGMGFLHRLPPWAFGLLVQPKEQMNPRPLPSQEPCTLFPMGQQLQQ